MSLIGAPLPPEPAPWENNDYEDNIEEDSEQEEEEYSVTSDTEYDSDFSDKPVKFKILRKSKVSCEIVPYYKNILQEEEYFSE